MTARERTVGHILIAEDESALGALLAQHLEALGHKVTTVADGRAAMSALDAKPFDVALLDIVMPPPDGLEVLRALADDADPPAVIIATGQGTVDAAVQAMRLGAFAYLSKPYRIAELDVVVTRAIEFRALAQANTILRAQVARAEGGGDTEFLTQYAPLRAVFAAALSAAAQDGSMLVVGAHGTGKCALARAVHNRSARAARPFVVLDPATLGGADAERVLFGAERAEQQTAVRPALASRGTLYLQDVLALAPRIQVRLARAMRDGRFRTMGGNVDRAIRARIIGACTEPADAPGSRFHPDLAAALGGTTVTLPRLTERSVDIPVLAEAFLAVTGDPALRFDDGALTALQQYRWPGNVAELRAVVERARLLSRDGVIRVTDLALLGDASELELVEVERRHIEAVLRAKRWHQGKAADSLGISPKTLYRKIREYGLRRPGPEERA